MMNSIKIFSLESDINATNYFYKVWCGLICPWGDIPLLPATGSRSGLCRGPYLPKKLVVIKSFKPDN